MAQLILNAYHNVLITTGSADYVTISMMVGPFNDATREQCFNVTITDDLDPERDEVFFIDFVPTLDTVNIQPSRVSVTILDNDCKLIHYII